MTFETLILLVPCLVDDDDVCGDSGIGIVVKSVVVIWETNLLFLFIIIILCIKVTSLYVTCV